jgi:small conductance mechanosensitive channel
MSEIIDAATQTVSTMLGETGLRIVAALLILLVGWIVAGYASRAVRRAAERSGALDATLTPLFAKITRLFLLAVTIVMALDKLGVDTTSIIAFLGALGLAVGLALKDTIADLASGIILLVLRPLRVGEAVDIGGEAGMVQAIDLFETKLDTFDGVPLVIPNSRVRTSIIKNFSRAQRRRVDLAIGVAYEADVGRAIELIGETLRADARILPDPDILVNVDALADSSVDLLVRFWTLPEHFLLVKMDSTRAIKLALDEAGISIPYPKRDLFLKEVPKALRVS